MNTTTTVPSVALLFADADVGSHLREALSSLGARIAYEGPAGEVRGEDLARSRADVVVVNLEPGEVEHLDRLYDVLEGRDWRVIFNDAEASRDLSGWDRARWARHLAAKLVGGADVDPPRPEGARVDTAGSIRVDDAVSVEPEALDTTDPAATSATPEAPDESLLPVMSEDPAGPTDARSEAMEAELEILMSGSEGKESVHEAGAEDVSDRDPMSDATPATESVVADGTPFEIEERQTRAAPAPVADWELVGADSEASAPVEREPSARYGVEKVEASEFLTPTSGEDASAVEPSSTLELVSLEESVAPTVRTEAVSEMRLDDSTAGIRRVVVVAAGSHAGSEIADFLGALPRSLQALVLVAQDQQEDELDGLAQFLSATTSLSVKRSDAGTVARMGEAWLLPAGKYCRVKRDGQLEWHDDTSAGHASTASIAPCLESLAPVFGNNVTLVVLSGDGSDALAGARLIASGGGEVWVHEKAAGSGNGMAHAIEAEGLAVCHGMPAELALRLVEGDA